MRARGVVVTTAGDPVPDAMVRAMEATDGLDSVTYDQSDVDGCFTLSQVTSPRWHRFNMSADAEGYKSVRRRLWANRDNLVVVTLELSTQQGLGGIDAIYLGSSSPTLKKGLEK
jgi:hypothetical protein